MADSGAEGPIPVLLVGEGAKGAAASLTRGLSSLGLPARFSCASFESAPRAADASSGAPLLILIAFGSDAGAILADPVWRSWDRPGSAIARVAVAESILPSGPIAGADFSADSPGPVRIDPSRMEVLPLIVGTLARLLVSERRSAQLERRLGVERACESLAACLEPGKLYSLTLDVLLESLDRSRGIAVFAPSPAPQGAGVATRGFEDPAHTDICHRLIEEKAIASSLGEGEVAVVPFGPLHHVLGRAGLEAPGALLSVPLRGQDREVGHVWILSEGARFDEADLEAARIIARRSCSALDTAERYHQAKERAFVDDVTGVYNARYLLTTTDNEIQRAARYGNPLSVLFLDLDRFKTVNDRFGHLVGSDTLRRLADLLAQCVRQVDTLARYGGDEFTILLVDTPHETALAVAERIRRTVAEHLFEAGGAEGGFQVSISIGVATCPPHGSSGNELLDAADKAMYRAKSEGRNRICSASDLPPSSPEAFDPTRPGDTRQN